MLERLTPQRRRLVLFALAALVLWFAWTVRAVLNPIILGYLLAYVLHPLVRRVERWGLSRRAAVNLIFTVAGVAVVLTSLGLFLQGRELWREVTRPSGVLERIDARVGAGVEEIYATLSRWGIVLPHANSHGEAPADLGAKAAAEPSSETQPTGAQLEGERAGAERAGSLRTLFQDLGAWLGAEADLSGAGQAGLRAAGGLWVLVRSFFGSIFSFVTLLLVLPIYTYFLLFELDRIHDFVLTYIPHRERDRWTRIGRQIGQVLSSFFRGRLLVCFLKGLFLSLGLWLAGVPYAFLLGLTSGALALIPVVGPALGFIVAWLLALLAFPMFPALVRVGLIYLLGEIIEGYVLLPKIVGDSLGLHPVVVLASLMIGGAALGMFGLLIALPLAATLIILTRELLLPSLRQAAEEKKEEEPAP
jgi:predicted PurR-regulated permease PerM